MNLQIHAQFPPILDGFFDAEDVRYFVLYGGRGSGKSWSVAQHVIIEAMLRKVRILCCREIQQSIRQSAKKLITDTIERMGCRDFFTVKDQVIICKLTGSEFIFSGLWQKENTIRSMEGIDICWVEEAQSVSAISMRALTPTLRNPNAYFLFTMNPRFSTDWVYENFIAPEVVRPDVRRIKINYMDNPWFYETSLVDDMQWDKATNPALYRHIWEGDLNLDDDALVFKGNVVQVAFPTTDTEFMFGQDYGFSQDPMAFTRSWMSEDEQSLYIDYEAGGMNRLALFDHPKEMDRIPGSRTWPIVGDSARPDYIDWLAKQGYAISGCQKYAGSVEDGIAWLQSVRIFVHVRCPMTYTEFCTHKFQRHAQTDEITRKPEDKDNHFIDATRYAWQSKWMRQRIHVGGN